MLQPSKETRFNLCHIYTINKFLNEKKYFRQSSRCISLVYPISFLMILLLSLHLYDTAEGALSTSKSQLKHERNGKCKYLNLRKGFSSIY